MRAVRLSCALGITLALALAACGDDSGSGGSGGSGGSTTSTTSSTKSATSSTGSTGSTTTGSTTTSSTGTTTGVGGGVDADHLVINEVVVAGNEDEFVEIHNPTATAVALDDYYLSDNSTYVDVASGAAWDPITNNPGTDFLARFPAGATIPAGGYLVIGFDPGYEASWGGCPDYFVATAPISCNGQMVPVLEQTDKGSITDGSNLSNMREMLVLFTWTGDTNDTLQDVDYVTWGDMFEAGSRADKSAVMGYQADTPVDMQSGAPVPGAGSSIERCGPEVGETLTGGNGLTGHDETSEVLASSFFVEAAPTPGAANVCP